MRLPLPSRDGPGRLWSLLDMKPIEVALVAEAAAAFAGARSTAAVEGLVVQVGMNVIDSIRRQTKEQGVNVEVNVDDPGSGVRGLIQERVLASILVAERGLKGADLDKKFHAKVERIKKSVLADPFKSEDARVRMEELYLDLIAELSEPMFLHIAANRRTLYEQKSPSFGLEVDLMFPDAKRDIEAASRCLALDEWTACVFHCMRVLEHGLRPLAQRFNVDFKVYAWHAVIKDVEQGIDALRNKGNLTDKDREEITFYSDAATQFRYFKDAWRNHVSHAREHYDERDADKVYGHVRDFMQHMVSKP